MAECTTATRSQAALRERYGALLREAEACAPAMDGLARYYRDELARLDRVEADQLARRLSNAVVIAGPPPPPSSTR